MDKNSPFGKQHRGEQKTNKRPDAAAAAPKPHEQAQKAPDMPALGGAGDPLAGGMASAAEDPAQIAAQQAELARVKSLPAGSPDLEALKKPEATGAQVPEGNANTSAAKSAAQGMSPKQEAQAPATLGPSAQQVSSEPGGLKVEVKKEQLYQEPPSSGPAAEGAANASAGPQAVTKAQEKSGTPAQPPASDQVAKEDAEKKQPEAPKDAKADAPGGEAKAAANVEPAPAPLATPESPQKGDAAAEAKGASAPESAPAKGPETVAAAPASAPEGAVAPVPEGQAAPAEVVAVAAPAGQKPADVQGQVAPGAPGKQEQVAAASVPGQVAGKKDQAADGAVAQAPGASAEVGAEAAPVAQGAAGAPVAPDAKPADAPQAQVAQVAGSAPAAPAAAAAAGPEVAAPELAAGAVKDAGGGAVGDAPVKVDKAIDGQPGAAGNAEPVAEAAVDPAAAAARGDVPKADVAPVAEAAPVAVGQVPVDAGSPSPVAAAAAAGGKLEAATETLVEGADATAGGDLADAFAGRQAAAELGSTVFGLTADNAATEAEAAPKGEEPAAVEAVAGIGKDAGLDPASLVPEIAAEQKKQMDTLFGAADAAKGLMGKGAPAGSGGALDQWLAKGSDALGKGKGFLDDAKGMLGDVKDLAKDPIGAIKKLSGGKALPGGIREKAEKSLGMDFGDVKVFGGEGAEKLAGSVGASAFAAGKDIVFGNAAKMGDVDQKLVMAEELVHVAQMKGQGAAKGQGVSLASDRAEKSARTAAAKVMQGAEIDAKEYAGEARALYRNTGGAAPAEGGAEMPTSVQLSLAGKSITVKLPKLTTGTTSKMVSLPALNVKGLSFEAQARFKFDATTGKFTGGTAYGTIGVGDVITLADTQVTIDQNGVMKTSFSGATFKVGSLINDTITAVVGAGGVTGKGTYQYSQLRGAKLDTWLKSGSLSANVTADAAVTGTGTLGIEVGDFSAGNVKASIENKALSGTVTVDNKNSISLGKAAVSTGTLTGPLTNSEKVALSGALKLDVPALSGGKGTVQATWDSDGTKIAGQAAYQFTGSSTWGKIVFTKASLTGEVADTKMSKMAGSGTAVYDALFKGNWNGDVDLGTEKANFELGGELVAPLIQGEVQVSKGALTIKVQANELKSTAGKVDFKLGSFLKGTAVLEEGTSANTINATATAELVSAQTFGGVTLSKGSIVVQVRGPNVKTISGSVDVDYKGVATGKLSLTESAEIHQFSGSGKANLKAPLQWGDIKVLSGAIDLALKRNVVDRAQGQMKIGYLDKVEGQMSFDATKDFTAISGTATASLVKQWPLTSPLTLEPDASKKFDLAFKNSVFDNFRGSFSWKYEKFKGDVNVTTNTQDFGLITGTGKADLSEDLPIGTAGTTKLMGKPSSTLVGKMTQGAFLGVSGTLKWEYDSFLAGTATIAEPRTTITEIDGMLKATVIAAKNLPNNAKVQIQPGAADALTIELRNSVAKRYQGKLDYKYDGFLKGGVTIAGAMLDFSTLAGTSAGSVYAKKTIKNVDILSGSSMNVAFVDSNFTEFDGSINFVHKDWLKGVATAVKGGGSSMTNGVVGELTGTLLKTPPGGAAKGFKYLEGGSVKSKLVAGMDVTTFDAGSQVNWKYEDWLGGKLTLAQQSTILSADGTDMAANLLKEQAISTDKKVVFLPSSGIGVELVNGTPAKYMGSVAARYEDWIKGTFKIAPSSGAKNFDGDLSGALTKAVPLTGTPVELQPGGTASVHVASNVVDGIKGTLEFKYGEGSKWLEGTVASATSTGAGITSISGNVTGKIIDPLKLSNMVIKTGGAVATKLEQSYIKKLGGTVAYEWGADEKWLAGTIEVDAGTSTPRLISGTHTSNIVKDFKASTELKLTPTSGLKGKVEQNDVKTIGGPIAWQHKDWLAGKFTAEAVRPDQVGGTGEASIIKKRDIIPGKLWLMPGGGLTAKVGAGVWKTLSGDVPFQWDNWFSGTVKLTDADESAIRGRAKGTVIGPGKQFGMGAFGLKLLPGGTLTTELTNNGVEKLSGEANAEYGQANDGTTWHVKGKMVLQDTTASLVKGDFSGSFASPLKFQPNPFIEPGGSIKFHIEGAQVTQPFGDVIYSFKRGQDPFLKGTATLDASSTQTKINAAIKGTIVKETLFGGIKILPGGALDGTLRDNVKATLGGNLAFQYENYLKGSLKIQGQINPDQAKVSGAAEATTLTGQKLGPFNIGAGSQLGVKVVDSLPKQLWGKLNVTTADLRGVISVPQGNASTPESVSGDATVTLLADKNLGGGFFLKGGSSLSAAVEKNELKQLKGSVAWRWEQWVGGTLTAETGSTLTQISGTGNALLLKKYSVGSTGLSILAGSGVAAKVLNNKLDSVSGTVLWSYDATEWLVGDVTMPEGTKLESPAGTANARLAKDKLMPPVLLKQGGSLTADIAAGKPTTFAGKVLWQYPATDGWLEGDVTLNAGSKLESLNGTATARLARDKEIATGLTLLKGGNVVGTMTNSEPSAFTGDVGWKYETWLEGKVHVQASDLKTIQGSADAHLVDVKMVAPGFELQKGGQAKVTVGASAFKTFTGEVNWKYSEGEPFAQGSVKVASESSWDSISGQADAQLVNDIQAASDLKLLKAGSNIQVNIAGSKIKDFGGNIAFLYGDDQWIKGVITVDKGSTQKKISGTASASVVKSHLVEGTEFTITPGSTAKVVIANNEVKSFSGTLNFKYGEDPWLKGSIQVSDGANAKQIKGKIAASLSKYKRISDEIKFMEGGSLKASFDGTSVKQFSGNLTMGYEDWLLGELKVDNSSLDDVTGSVKATLRKHKEINQDLMLKMGGSVELKLASSKLLEFSGDVNWSYQQWLEGSMKVQASTGKELTGVATATIIQQKMVGEANKLEIQRGSSLHAKFSSSKLDGVGGELAWRYDGWLKGAVTVPDYVKIDQPSGTITAGLLTDKDVGNELTLKRGGSVTGDMQNGSLKKIGGNVEWNYQGWLGGTVTLNPSAPDALTGKATASVIQAKEVKTPLTIDRGGSMTIGFDTKKSMLQQQFSANLSWWYEKWLGGNLEVSAGSTFDNLSGKADVQLKEEKVYDKLTLRRGGQLRAVFTGSKPDSFGGDLNWMYESWIGGTVKVNDGSKLSSISGQAAASLLEDKPLGNQFTLLAGGHAQVTMAANKVDSFSGMVLYKWKDLIDGSVEVAGSSKLDKISGKATAHLAKDYQVGGSQFWVKQGTSVQAVVTNSSVESLSGQLGWRYDKWAEGNVRVASSKLDSISGQAQGRIVQDQPLGDSGLKLNAGGSVEVEVKNNSLTSFGGSINIQYKDLAKGSLTITGKAADLKTVSGEAKARLINDYALGNSGAKLLNGSGLGVKVVNGAFDSFSGLVRFQYKDQIVGAIELVNSKPDSINGSASAQVMKDFSPTGGQFFLTQGGNLRTDFKNSTFETIEGEVIWRYDNPSAKLDGRLTIPRSPIKSISGKGTARLLQDTAPIADTKLLAGGNLSVNVAANAPKSLTGRIDWLHSNWIGGYVELLEGTNVTGPFKGKAGASLKNDKPIGGGKFTLLKGGNIELQLDSTQSVENQQISGMIAAQYETWLKGSLTVDAGTTLKNIAGTAKAELIGDKDLGTSGVTLLQGGNIQAKFSTKGLDSFGGVIMVDYQKWLRGSVNANTGSTPDAITGSITAQLTKEKGSGDFKLQPGGQVSVAVAASKLGGFGGVVNWKYQDWATGTLNVAAGAKLESIGGQGSASITAPHMLPAGKVELQPGGHARVKVADSKLSTFSGEVNVKVDSWLDGAIVVTGESDLKSVSGNAHLRTYGGDKDVGGQVKIKDGSGFQASMVNSEVTNISGTLGFSWKEMVGGQITVNSGSTLKKISGSATVSLLAPIDVGGGVKLVKGGAATIAFDGASIKSLSGQLALSYDTWLQGTISVNAGSTFESLSGTAELSVKAGKSFGKVAIKEGSFLAVDFAGNKVTEYRGNIDVGYEDWLKGNLNFKAQDLKSISGSGSLNVTTDHKVGGPVSILGGSYIRANFDKSELKDFGGTIGIAVKDWGKGSLTVNDGSTPKAISGSGQIELTQPKPLGSYVTITRAKLGATLEKNEIKSIYGEAQGDVKNFGTGWLKIDKSSTLTEFDGQAGLKLTTPKPIGSFAELSGGQITANFQKNNLKDFGGVVDIKVIGWGKGNVTIDAGSTMDYIKGSAKLTLTEPKTIGGIVKITGGSVSATVDGQKLTKMAGSIELQIRDEVKGSLQGQIDVETQKVSGQGKLEQVRPWTVGPVKIQDASLSATVTDNKLTGASGKATIDAGKIGRGGFDVNYENVGDAPKFYGSGWVEFQPHDRIKGKLTVNLSRDQKLTGEGTVNVKISDKINGMVGVALDDQGHVKIKGSVTIPGPFEIFKPSPYKKDVKLLDLSFMVYTPPTVKVKVGAGIGLEVGIKPLTISNIVVGGECDLMEPSFASMSVSAHLASSAYADLNAYVEGSVAVSAAVVAVEAGLRAALNLHLEAAITADPCITVNRNGLSFDMPVDARLSAALNLILTFFAKVRVGIDVGLFSIMKTVWRYDKSPDPLRLAEMSIGAKGRVKADSSGFSATMNPEYQPPDMSLDSLKRAIGLD